MKSTQGEEVKAWNQGGGNLMLGLGHFHSSEIVLGYGGAEKCTRMLAGAAMEWLFVLSFDMVLEML